MVSSGLRGVIVGKRWIASMILGVGMNFANYRYMSVMGADQIKA